MAPPSRPPSRRPPPKRSGVRSSALLPGELPAFRPGAKVLVLVVDDLRDNREMYVEYLEFQGFDVISAGDGREAVDKAIAHLPDVVIMDMSLPVMDGWEATRILRATASTRELVVIAVSGHAETQFRRRAIGSGCDLFVAKPCLPQDLVVHIREQLALRSRPRTMRGKKG
jgi:two-component system, cell cycle response regulator DivK